MKRPSLRIRLIFAAAISAVAALAFTGLLIANVFDRQIAGQLKHDLTQQLDQLAAHLVINEDGTADLDADLTDPRYERPLSGLYWQIDEQGRPPLRSRSLWDTTLNVTVAHASGDLDVMAITGPGGVAHMALSRDVTLRDKQNVKRQFRLSVAEDATVSESNRRDLFQTLGVGLGIACLALVAAAIVQIGFGLRPLEAFRREIEFIRRSTNENVKTVGIPTEVLSLAEEINALLDYHRSNLERARRRAGDLAHGLKTPLAALAAQADLLAMQGNVKEAEAVRRHLNVMHRHVERELALARSQGGSAAIGRGARPTAQINSIVETLKKLPSDHTLHYSIIGPVDIALAMNLDDFDEITGNLIDNARKWARNAIVITVTVDDMCAVISVEDDGPGIPEQEQSQALERGTRLDEKSHGSGFGLSIVEALLENYGSQLKLARSPRGGLLASFVVPLKKP